MRYILIKTTTGWFKMDEKDKLTILNFAYDYLFGSLWWGAERFIRERFEDWQKSKSERERKGHPLLSLCETLSSSLCDEIPMLVGTSVKGKAPKDALLIHVSNDHLTDFSTQTESHLIFAEDLLSHSENRNKENNPVSSVWDRRRIWPNWGKTHSDEEEVAKIRAYLDERKETAVQNRGINKWAKST